MSQPNANGCQAVLTVHPTVSGASEQQDDSDTCSNTVTVTQDEILYRRGESQPIPIAEEEAGPHYGDRQASDGETENVLEFDAACQIAPYRFEPVPRPVEPVELDSDSESEESEAEIDASRDWCSCQNCGEMGNSNENKCCHSYKAVRNLLEDGPQCITQHEGFIGNCLNRYVLEASVYEFVQDSGSLGDDEPVHELMRYLAYRRFIRWVFGKLGKKNRRVIPACAVKRIRHEFPSDFYHGFRYPIY